MNKDDKQTIPVSETDLTVTGTVMGRQDDTITYTSKKTGKEETLRRDVVVIMASCGMIVCRFYNPSVDLSVVCATGNKVTLPISSYQIENGLKTVNVRI